jgi:hexosaminidase
MFALLVGSVGAQPHIIPTPNSMTAGAGNFVVPAALTVYCDAQSDSIYPWIQKLFTQAGVTVQSGPSASAQIQVTRNSALSSTLTAEGYNLTVTTSTITIAASAYAGQFYAVQTLRQLLPPGIEKGALPTPINIPVVTISDKPKYQYRGNMLDLARHYTYATIAYLEQHIDHMSLYKMNTFHMHIGDDQGWRLQMNSYPALTSVGGQSQAYQPSIGDKQQTGNFYLTQTQMAQLINFAAVRNITIIPEFDMPGHTGEITYSLPKTRGCSSPDYATTSMYTGIETNWSALCVAGSGATAATISYTDTVLQALFKEISGIFPSKYISIGGDEATNIAAAAFNPWIQHMETVFSSNNKYMIGWEEIKASGASTLSTTWGIAWNHTGAGEINANCQNEFIDHANAGSDKNAMSWCESEVTLNNVYTTPMTSVNKGVECCLWSEYVINDSIADIRLYPRMLATSEVGWAASNSNYATFETNVAPQGARLDDMGVHWFSSAYDDGTPTWIRATPSSSYTSVFGEYTYTYTQTGVIAPMILNSAHSQALAAGKIIDLRGRVVGTMTSHGPEMSSANVNVSRGIYFIVGEKGNMVQISRKLFVNE